MKSEAMAAAPNHGWLRIGRFRLPPAVVYVASIAIDRGFSIITIPVVTAYLTPAEYGRLELGISLVEFVNIVMLLGLSDTALRFASTTPDPVERSRCSAELMGAALLVALVLTVASQAILPIVAGPLGVKAIEGGLRWAIVGACASALIDMPLAWLRMEERAGHYCAFIAFRALVQLAGVIAVLTSGYGAEQLLQVNAVVVLALAGILSAQQISHHGIALSKRGIERLWSYGAPLIVAALAMFLLGSCSRWFLAGRVPDEEIAFFALAAKLAAAAALFMQPFMLWWKPRRLMVLGRPDGVEIGKREWGLGFLVLVASILLVSVCVPVFISLCLKADYSAALKYFPYLLIVVFLNELCALCSIGSYAKRTGLSVMAINGAGAAAAVLSFVTLIGPFSIMGAIGGMIIGHLTRLVLFVGVGLRSQTLRIPVRNAFLPLGIVITAFALSVSVTSLHLRVASLLLILTALCVFAVAERVLTVALLRSPES